MSVPHPRRTGALAGIAGAGLVLGHWLAYAVDTPHAHARDELLRATGHGYLPYLTQVALLAGAIGLASVLCSGLRRGVGSGSFVRDVVWLTTAQSGAFVAMEIGERLLSGASLHDLTHGPLLAIGLGVQLAIALAGALLLRLTDRAADTVARRADAIAPPLPGLVRLIGRPADVPRTVVTRGASSRAPPSPA